MSDNATGKIIYHNSYSSLFCEWQLTLDPNPSGDYKECVRMPMPKRPATVYLTRNYQWGQTDTIMKLDINPATLPHPTNANPQYKVETLHAAIIRQSISLVFLPEGYKEDEMDKFLEAARKMANGLFEYEPFSHHYKAISIQAVLAPSPESGVDIPSEGIERNTLMDFSYDTFDTERYMGNQRIGIQYYLEPRHCPRQQRKIRRRRHLQFLQRVPRRQPVHLGTLHPRIWTRLRQPPRRIRRTRQPHRSKGGIQPRLYNENP